MLADVYLGDHILLRPAVSLAASAAAAALVLAALLWTWMRRRLAVSGAVRAVLLALRAAIVLAVIALLLRPVILWEGREAVRPGVAILIDATRSMTIRDAPAAQGGGTPVARAEAVRAAFAAAGGTDLVLARSADVAWFAFGSHLAPIDGFAPPPDDRRTDPGGALGALADQAGDSCFAQTGFAEQGRLAAVVLVSDGRASRAAGPSADQAARALAARGTRVHTVGVGSPAPTAAVRDVAVRDLRAPGRVFAGDRATVRAVVAALGLEGREVRVVLKVNGRAAEERILRLASNLVTEEVVLTPRLEAAGLARLALEAAPLAGEITDANNRAETATRVEEGGVRVLYLEGEIRPEAKYVARALADARQIDLERRILVGAGAGAAAPAPADLDAFDVLVLGDLPASALPAATIARAAERIKAGRLALLALGGRRAFGAGGWAATPLADLLPFAIGPGDAQVAGPVRFVPTAAGRRHFILGLPGGGDAFAALAPLPGACGVGALDPAGRVLAASADGRPILAVREWGAGRAAALTVDSTWLWVLSSDDPQGPEHHARLWRQLILWLAHRDGPPRDDLWIVTDRFRYEVADSGAPPAVQVAVHAPPGAEGKAPAAPAVRLRGPDGSVADVPLQAAGGPGDWRVTLRPDRAGEYALTAEIAGPGSPPRAETPFVIEEQDLETAEVLADHDALRAIAAAGGGTFRTLDGLPALLQEIGGGLRPTTVPAGRCLPLASGPAFLAGVLALLAAEWALRRAWGLA